MFIIDFDDTLFDTQAFKHARLNAIKKIGVTEKEYWETYKKAAKNLDGLSTYSDHRHADMLELQDYNRQEVLAALQTTTGNNLTTFLMPGAHELLKYIKTKEQPVILLSLGDASFQEIKVKGAGIHDYFDRTFYVDKSKKEVVTELLKNHTEEETYFINDKVTETTEIKNSFPNINTILRISPNIPTEQYNQTVIPKFETLKEIQVYIIENTK